MPASCTEPGTAAYYLGNDGKKYDLYKEVVDDELVIPAAGHDFVDGRCTKCGEPDESSLPESFSEADEPSDIGTSSETDTSSETGSSSESASSTGQESGKAAESNEASSAQDKNGGSNPVTVAGVSAALAAVLAAAAAVSRKRR